MSQPCCSYAMPFSLLLQRTRRIRETDLSHSGTARTKPYDVDATSTSYHGLLQNRGVSGCGLVLVLTGSVHGEGVPPGGPGSAVFVPAGYAGVAAAGSPGVAGDRGGGGSPGYQRVPCVPQDGRAGDGGV